ncbi:MAG: 6-bladed beta-propeller [Deltaproteobacteria bacterium]|nr:6-bladed beta-propeller [Deltaproteobacteria bacterium]
MTRKSRTITRLGLAAAFVVVALASAAILWGNKPIPSLVYLHAIGTEEGLGRLLQPVGVAVSPGAELFVTDSGNQRISVFDEQGTFLRAFGQEGNGPGELDRPMHLSFGPDGFLYVAEYINDRISVFHQDGTFVRHLKPKGVDAPSGVAVDAAGAMYVADFYNHRVIVLSPDGSERVWGHAGQGGLGELHYPTDVAIGPEGEVWVADAYNNRLQRFVAGKATQMITGITVANGVAVDRDGRVWAVDFEGGRVRAFNPNGAPLTVLGEPGSGREQLRHPTAVAVTGSRVYVADFGNDRIQVWGIGQGAGSP